MVTIDIRTKNLEASTEDLDFVQDRIHASIDQHESKISHVKVLLRDENGDKGGIDQFCQISVYMHNGKVLHHKRTGDDLLSNVSILADTVKRRIGRAVGKEKDWDKQNKSA